MKNLEYKIVNSVVSTRICGPFNLEILAISLLGCEYRPKIFAALVIRRSTPKATLTLFPTGRFAAYSPSVTIAIEAMEAVVKEISAVESRDINLDIFKIENIVATSDLGVMIDLDEFVGMNENCLHEPEQFPGAICHLRKSVVILVFSTGRAVCVGAKSEDDIRASFDWLRERLKK